MINKDPIDSQLLEFNKSSRNNSPKTEREDSYPKKQLLLSNLYKANINSVISMLNKK